MRGKSTLIDDFYRMHRGFGYLQSINLYRDKEDIYSKCYLDVILCKLEQSKQRMFIHFSGVARFESSNLDSLNMSTITIVDMSANQWEDINYKVKEDEDELFSFYCKDFEYKLIE